MKNILMILFLLLFSFKTKAQIKNVIDSLQEIEQKCLDSGWRMPSCAYVFYTEMDSLLNLKYKECLNVFNDELKAKLKKSELIWLKKRDIFLKKTR